MIIPKTKSLSFLILSLSVLAPTVAVAQTRSTQRSRPVRERVSIDDDWRFQQGDPAGATGLLYDVRPPLKGEVQDKAPDAAAEEAEKHSRQTVAFRSAIRCRAANPATCR